VRGLTQPQRDLIDAFMHGAVYCWVKNRQGETFTVRDLVGGVNRDWTGTPLQVLFEKHQLENRPLIKVRKAAGHDLGWIVAALLTRDARTFRSGRRFRARFYSWVQPTLGERGDDPPPDATLGTENR